MQMIDSTEVLKEFKCQNCAGKVEWDSKNQIMKCPYCDSEFDVKAMTKDEDLTKEIETKPDWQNYDENSGSGNWKDTEKDEITRYICNFCAGEILTNEQTSATKCPYCDNPIVILTQLDGMLRPDLVVPFSLNKEDAKKKFSEFLNNKKLLPNCFKDKNHIEEIVGIYVPFWLYDCTAKGDINFKATKVNVWSDSRYTYTKTSHYSLNRTGQIEFIKIPADGSKKMDDTLMEAIEPFDYGKAVDFKTAYLSGYLAEKYDVTAEENQSRINERISESLVNEARRTISGYATCTTSHKNISSNNANISYALLPVWILNTQYKNEKYIFAMNGQTGKFVGKLPVDNKKAFMNFAGVFAISSIIFSVISFFL